MDIAYAIGGTGRPVVVLPFHWSNIQRKWTAAYWAPGLAERNRVIAYDSRGQGSSTRHLESDPTVGEYRLDLEAVLQATGMDHVTLVAYGGFAHVAISFAADHPEVVDALVLICSCESFSAWPLTPMLPLAEENWDLFLDLMCAKQHASFKEYLIDFIKEGATKSDFIRMVRGFSSSNVTDLLDRIQLPVLLIHSLDQHWLSVDEGKRFAAKVRGSRLVFINGDIEPSDVEGVRAIQAFLDELPGAPADTLGVEELPSMATLSARQQEVLKLLSVGKTTREIASELVLSDRTVERHISDIYRKIGVTNRAAAIAYALRAPTPV